MEKAEPPPKNTSSADTEPHAAREHTATEAQMETHVAKHAALAQ